MDNCKQLPTGQQPASASPDRLKLPHGFYKHFSLMAGSRGTAQSEAAGAGGAPPGPGAVALPLGHRPPLGD